MAFAHILRVPQHDTPNSSGRLLSPGNHRDNRTLFYILPGNGRIHIHKIVGFAIFIKNTFPGA
jgi:hypothetical protein